MLKDLPVLILMIVRKLRTLRRSQGLWATAVFCARTLGEMPRRARLLFAEAAYDRRRGVETSRLVKLEHLGIDSAKLDGTSKNASGIAYMPTPAWVVPAILQDMGLRYEDYSFIDLGSGMGRVVLAAAEYPFRKVVGVEFSQELHRIAERNLARVSRRFRAGAIDLICQDAREYTFPNGNCMVYLFNPFREEVMRQVLKNLEQAYIKTHASLCVIYYNPVLATMLDSAPFLTRIKSTREYSIYCSAPEEYHLAPQQVGEFAISGTPARNKR